MGDFVYNRSLGRGTEYCERVNGNDPTNAAIIIGILATAGIESDATLKDKDEWTALVSGATNFVTNSGYARKTIDQAGGIVITYDDSGDKVDIDIPDQTWTGVGAGDGWNDLVTGYDSDTTGGTDTNILPWTQHDFVVVPDGSDITAQIAAAGLFRAS